MRAKVTLFTHVSSVQRNSIESILRSRGCRTVEIHDASEQCRDWVLCTLSDFSDLRLQTIREIHRALKDDARDVSVLIEAGRTRYPATDSLQAA